MSTTTVAILLYLFTRLTAISSFISGLSIVFGLWVVGSIVGYYIWFLVAADSYRYNNEDWHTERMDKLAKFIKKVIVPSWLVCASLFLLIPNKNDTMLIVGGALGYHGVNAVVSDNRVQDTGGKALELMNTWLDQQIAERRIAEEAAED